ncbi:MAG TPA: ester cyclase [Solirubrobacterales bacterium]|jgi:predicted ester cyclase|nr:ester cyclase [Solirubrobacterales bacterium]
MATEETTRRSRSTEEVARAYFDRIDARDLAGMMELWEPGGIGNIHGIVVLRVPDSYSEWFGNLFAAFPDMRFEVLDVVAEGDQAAVRWRATGTFNGTKPFEGLQPTAASVEMEGLDLLTIRDGRLVSNDAYTNSMELARQLGALPAKNSVADRGMTALFNLRTRAVDAIRGREA